MARNKRVDVEAAKACPAPKIPDACEHCGCWISAYTEEARLWSGGIKTVQKGRCGYCGAEYTVCSIAPGEPEAVWYSVSGVLARYVGDGRRTRGTGIWLAAERAKAEAERLHRETIERNGMTVEEHDRRIDAELLKTLRPEGPLARHIMGIVEDGTTMVFSGEDCREKIRSGENRSGAGKRRM